MHGTVTNNTGSPVSGLQVAMQTSQGAFSSRSQMESYVQGSAGGSAYFPGSEVGSPFALPGIFHTGTTKSWSVSFPSSDAGYGSFGVYPLAAVVYNSALSPLASERTLLPYWPGNSGANPVKASWIWPLVDQPQQGPCPQTLADNSLAASLKPTGRLGGLLNTGLQWSGQADLTWAVDPALLSEAQTMTSDYKIGGNAACDGSTSEPASPVAQNWLNTLKTGAAGQPMFVTPYADADTTALAHAGLLNNMKDAYDLGDQIASQSLIRPFGKTGGTGDGGAPSVAWLPGGPTDKGVLSALQETGKVNTAVVGSDDEPSFPSTGPATTPTRSGRSMKLLTADSGLTDVLGTAGSNASPGAQFATEQDFLAQTAMIVDEEPFTSGRSIVIAPPRRWSPSGTEASALLKDSVQAPWLRPAKLSAVASSKAIPERLPSYQLNDDQLPSSYMGDVKAADSSLRNYQSLLYQPSTAVTQALEEALAGAASSAWRGPKAGAGTADVLDLMDFGPTTESKVKIIAGSKFLLTGASGEIAVSVQNGTSQTIQVRVDPKPTPDVGQLSVGKFNALLTVSPGKTGTVKMPVHAKGIETTTLRLQLVTQNKTPLPGTQQPLTVQATRYGQVLIYLIGAALVVVVAASGTRWVRRRRKGTTAGSGGTG